MNSKLNRGEIIYYLPVIGAISLIFRAIIPFQLYFFAVSTTVFLLHYLYKSGIKIFFSTLTNGIKQAKILFFIAIIYLLVLILSFSKNPLIYKELFRVVSVLLIYFQFYILVTQRGVSFLINIFINTYLIYISVFFIVLLLQIAASHKFTAILLDYDFNMIALYLLLAIIIILNRTVSTQEKVKTIFLNIILFLFSLLIILTSSRRGVIILSVSIIVYIYISKTKYNKYFKNIRIYLLLFLSTLLLSVYVLTDSNIKYYAFHKIQQEAVKLQFISISNRLSSILNIDNKKIRFFRVKPGYVFLRKKIEKDIKENNFTFDKLNYLAMFSKSKDKLKKYYPDIYLIPDSIYYKKSFTDIPAIYNVDFNFYKIFKPTGFTNSKLISFNQYSTDSMFIFKIKDLTQFGSFIFLLPISDSSIFNMSFKYKNQDSKIPVSLHSLNKKSINFTILKDTSIRLSDNNFNRQLSIKVIDADVSSLICQLSFSDTLVMSDVNWERKRFSKSLVYSPVKYNKDTTLRDRIIFVENKIFKSINVDSCIYVNDIYQYHDSILLTTLFSNYTGSKVLSLNTKGAEFNSQNKLGLVRKIIPAFPNTYYVISFITNIQPDSLYFYTKRYPEVNPHYLYKKELKRMIKRINNREILVKDSFYVDSSNSLQSLFIVGSKRGGDSLFIKDFTCKYYKDNNIILTSNQKKYINYIKGNQKFIKAGKNIIIRDSLANIYRMKFSGDNNLFKTRKERWLFSYKYFNKLPIKQKLFGDRLRYLLVFSDIMYINNKEKLEYDYPHNPIISAFLYSGIIGGILYLCFLMTIIYKFVIKREKLRLISVLFVISFIFAFFSGNSHFSIPVFAILSLFPFVYDKRIKIDG